MTATTDFSWFPFCRKGRICFAKKIETDAFQWRSWVRRQIIAQDLAFQCQIRALWYITLMIYEDGVFW